MDIFDLVSEIPRARAMVLALDGWTDAGGGGTGAATLLREAWDHRLLGSFDPDSIFDYRDRRPMMPIRHGVLGEPIWPSVDVSVLTAPDGTELLLVTGGEPDFAWQAVGVDLAEIAQIAGCDTYIGLGSVPGPVPHTRPVRIITTSNDASVLESHGRPREEVVVPASFQVMAESMLGESGLKTLGFWARIPHYVAGDYPDATRALLEYFSRAVGLEVDTSSLAEAIAANADRLAVAAEGSDDVAQHIRQLEDLYDHEDEPSVEYDGPLPTGDQIAEELERFLRGQDNL